jgi:streptogramin lyase
VVDQGYQGQVGFSSSDGTAILPDFYRFTPADHGAHTFPVTLRTAGRQTVTVTDTAQGNITGTAASISEFPVQTANSSPWGITVGPDNNLWFTETSAHNIGRITPGGVLREFPLFEPVGHFPEPREITAGPDGPFTKLWFTEENTDKIRRMDTDGGSAFPFDEFPTPTGGSGPFGIARGSDGNLWFTEQARNNIGRVNVNHAPIDITEFPVPTANSGPFGITAGPDGNLWFTENAAGKIGRITTAGMISEVGTLFDETIGITAGPDGNLWFTENGSPNKIGAITAGGIPVREFPIPNAGSGPRYITSGPDGNLWFTEYLGNRIGRITTGGVFTEFPVPTAGGGPRGITAGPDGNLWFTESNPAGNRIGRLIPGIDVTPAAADHFSLSAPDTVTSGAAFDLTVTVQDAFNNTVTGYSGTITFTTSDSDPGVVLPANYTFTAADGGVHTFTNTGLGETTLISEGDQTLAVSDPVSGLSGSATVTVLVGPVPAPAPAPGRRAMSPSVPPPGPSGQRTVPYALTPLFPGHDVLRIAGALAALKALPSLPATAASAASSTWALTPALEVVGVDRFFAASADQDDGFAWSGSKLVALLRVGDWWVDDLGKDSWLIERAFSAPPTA